VTCLTIFVDREQSNNNSSSISTTKVFDESKVKQKDQEGSCLRSSSNYKYYSSSVVSGRCDF
jgi:hypothetical protein